MADRDTNTLGRTVQAFLLRPLDKRCFDQFFKMCYSETMPYLRRLRASGWKLPEHQMQQETALEDLAYDVLGPFLAGSKNRPYFVVFDYFERHGLAKADVTLNTLEEHFRILLRGFIRKELTLIRGLENPQIRNLKRRIKDLLTGPDFAASEDCVYAVRNEGNLRDGFPPISSEALDDIVREAFRSSRNRSEWCTRIFQLLDEEPEVRTAIPRHLLISSMVALNAEHIDVAGCMCGHLPTPREQHLRQTTQRAVRATIDWLQSSVITKFAAGGRLASDDAPLILDACRAYLEDLSNNGDADKIPQYFLPLKPGLSQNDYLKRYKYVMDTVAGRALAELRRRLRSDPTIWPFGPYSPDEEF